MQKQLLIIIAGLLLGLSTTLAAAAEAITSAEIIRQAELIRDQALQESEAYAIVEELTMLVGPRPAGSAGDKAAVVWAEEMLRSLGLANVHTEAVTVPHWDRGSLAVQTISPYPQLLTATSLGGSIGTAERGLQAPVVRVADVKELAAIRGDELANKIVFIDKHMERRQDGGDYESTVAGRGCGPMLAEQRGALATVIRSVGTSEHRVPHTGSMSVGGNVAGIPAVALSNADADILAYQLQRNEPVTLSIFSSARSLPEEQSANVIGDIVGTDKADEIVILGAHLDSWDQGTGAIDDGAGVAIISAAAKLILDSGIKPRRTIRFVLFANEEFGLSGARAYAKAHETTIDKHVVGMEADFGAGAVWNFSSQVDESRLSLVQRIAKVLQPLDIKYGNNEASGGADISPLRAAGMPILDFVQDGTHYFDYHHTPDDTLDKIDRQALNQNVAVYAAAAFIAANSNEDFGRLTIKKPDHWSCDALTNK